MWYKMRIIGFLTVFLAALLAGVLLVCGSDTAEEPQKPELNLMFSIQTKESSEYISCWKDEAGAYYAFLPGYAEMENVYVADFSGTVAISGFGVEQDMSCGNYELGRAYSLICENEGTTEKTTLTFLRSGGIPTLYIDVQSGSMDYIHMAKGNKEPGTMRMYDEDGKALYSGKLESIKGRGNASWTADKKPYSVTLSRESDLLGMGVAQKWILLGDGDNVVNIRNKIVYDFAGDFGLNYSPDSRYVDLFLNGEYAGLYLLCERNEVHEERVDISRDSGFLVSQELEYRLQKQKYPYVLTESGQAMRIHYSNTDISTLRNQWQSAENAILSERGIDPISGKNWQELIDMDSWARKFLVEEMFGNNDGGAVSQYYYMDTDPQGKRIFAGPVWDYDYAMGGSSVWLRPYTAYLTMNRTEQSDTVCVPWYPALFQKDVFHQYMLDLFETEALPLMEKLVNVKIEEYADSVSEAIITDTYRWGIDSQSAFEDIAYIRSFLNERMDFLKSMWIDGETYHVVSVDAKQDGLFGHFAVKDGETLPEAFIQNKFGTMQWCEMNSGDDFDITQPIYESVHICIQKRDLPIPVIHYVPAAIAAAALPLMYLADRAKRKKERQRNDSAQIDEIPS